MKKIVGLGLLLLVSTPALGDLLVDADRLLCVPGTVSHCIAGQPCESGPPDGVNIPEFIEVDLKRKTLAATAASEEDRSTSVQKVTRQDGMIYLQGVEYGRAFNMMISEQTGDLVFMVATSGQTATMFGDCTPD